MAKRRQIYTTSVCQYIYIYIQINQPFCPQSKTKTHLLTLLNARHVNRISPIPTDPADSQVRRTGILCASSSIQAPFSGLGFGHCCHGRREPIYWLWCVPGLSFLPSQRCFALSLTLYILMQQIQSDRLTWGISARKTTKAVMMSGLILCRTSLDTTRPQPINQTGPLALKFRQAFPVLEATKTERLF